MGVMTMKSKDIAIVGILLAIGAILRYFLAMLHTPLTPNMIIAFYCLAIILIQPKIYEALGIGIVAGILSMLISSSMFPPGKPHQRTARGARLLWRLCRAEEQDETRPDGNDVHRHARERFLVCSDRDRLCQCHHPEQI